MAVNPSSPFVWGRGGVPLTPEQIALRQQMELRQQGQAIDTSPVGHWTQGAARVLDALGGVLRERRTEAAAAENQSYNSDLVNSILGGGADASAATGAPSTVPVAAVDPASLNVDPSIRDGIITTAQSLGIDPIDLGTAISYETAGTFDPVKTGPTTQWGQHRGLIQFGEPQAKEYGVDWNNPVSSQLGENGAVANYLRKAGVQPGMGMLDIYSAINAGRVGRYNASDANNGGAPGSVRDKVEQQMGGHRAKALALLGSSQPGQENSPDMGSVEQALGAPFVPSMSPPDPSAQAQQQELMTQVVGSPTAFRDPMVNAQGAQAAIDAQMTPQVNAQSMAPELPPPTTIANSPAVAQVAQAMPSAPQQQGTGVNQALIRALSDPRANDQTRAIAEILIRQDQARQQAAQEQSVWQQRQEYERQQQANDPLRNLQIQQAQVNLDNARNPKLDIPDAVQSLRLRAQEAGLQPGTPEYQNFFITQGVRPPSNIAAPPVGYRYEFDQNQNPVSLSPIPGSEAAYEQEQRRKQLSRQEGQKSTATDVVTSAGVRALQSLQGDGLPATGLVGQGLSFLPGTNAAEVRRQTDVLKSNATVENLNAMRAASPTGGALGSVTEKEGAMLAAKSGTLDPGSPNYERDLKDYVRTLLEITHGPEQGRKVFDAIDWGSKPKETGNKASTGVTWSLED